MTKVLVIIFCVQIALSSLLSYGFISYFWKQLEARRRIFSSMAGELRVAVLLVLSVCAGCLLTVMFVASIGSFSAGVALPSVEPHLSSAKKGSVVSTPNLCFVSKILYYVIQPQRGSTVAFLSEADAKVDPSWRSDIDPAFHFSTSADFPISSTLKTPAFVQRIIGMPGETITVSGERVYVDGKMLEEPYAEWVGHGVGTASFHLGEREFLAAEDVRPPESLSDQDVFHVVHLKQITYRVFFVLWPWELFGFVRVPEYNIPNPPALKIKINDSWLAKLTTM